MWSTARIIDPIGRAASLGVLVSASILGTVLYLAVAAVLGGPRPAMVVAMLRGNRRG